MARPSILATEFRSWLAVALWIIILLLTIPFARTFQAIVRNTLGDNSFGYFVVAVVVISVLYLILKLRSAAMALPAVNIGWLLLCAAFIIAYTFRLWGNPVEAVHFVQYGLLAALLFNAFLWRHKNYLVYVAVVLAAAAVGVIDEFLQWLTPGRVWGLSDITINSLAALVVCVAIAKGIRPQSINQIPNRASKRLVVRLALTCLLLLLISFANTPDVIKAYSAKIAPLTFLAENGHLMSEYGYRYEDKEIGVFRSRFSSDSLQLQDKERAFDAAQKLDAAPSLSDYGEFIRRYSPMTDPFLHELRVHLNRRDYYLKTGLQAARYAHAERQRRLQIAFFENRIVEKYFSNTLAQSSFGLEHDMQVLLEASVDKGQRYESPVSENLITFLSKPQLLLLLLGAIAVLLLFSWRLRTRADNALV